MPGQRKQYSADLKAKVALEAIQGKKTAQEIATEYGVHPSQITQWKKHVLEGLPFLFSIRANNQMSIENALIASLYQEGLIANLYQQVGCLKIQLDWLEKNHALEFRQALIKEAPPDFDTTRRPDD